jgi:hypothetical protein
MLKRIVLLSSLLVTSMTAHAGLIQYGDYKRDSASNIVTGGGLQWLMWDFTKGMSINSAMSKYEKDGWRLASNDEMASMYNSFKFGSTYWHNVERDHQSDVLPWDRGDELSPHASFIRLFGVTLRYSCTTLGRKAECYSDSDPYQAAQAIFGADADADGLYNVAFVVDDYEWIAPQGFGVPDRHFAGIVSDQLNRDAKDEQFGVALVRNRVPDNVAVPTPGSIGLLSLGLVALGYRRHLLGR